MKWSLITLIFDVHIEAILFKQHDCDHASFVKCGNMHATDALLDLTVKVSPKIMHKSLKCIIMAEE